MNIQNVISWFTTNWAQVVVIGWSVEKILEVIGTVTGNKIVDNLGVMLGNLLGKVSKKPE